MLKLRKRHCPLMLLVWNVDGDLVRGVIFISYRRSDAEGEAGRLYDDLVRLFSSGSVFMNVSDIRPGKDFRQVLTDNVSKCTVMLAVIGPNWIRTTDTSGVRRLDQPNDFVRLEVASALDRGIDVIPALVHGARMPTAAELPEDLQNLAYRNCAAVIAVASLWGVVSIYRQLKARNKDGMQASMQTLVQGQRAGGAVAPLASPPTEQAAGRSLPEKASEQALVKASATASIATPATPSEDGESGSAFLGWWYITDPPPPIPDGTPAAFYIGRHGNQFVVEMHASAGDSGTTANCGSQFVPMTNNGLSMVWDEAANPGCHFIRAGNTASVRPYMVGNRLHMTLTGKYPSANLEFKPEG